MTEKQLELWKEEAGPMPEYTCELIDYMQQRTHDSLLLEQLESLRKDNVRMRELGRFWYSKCQYIVGQLDNHGIKENV